MLPVLHPEKVEKPISSRTIALISCALALVILAIYAQSGNHPFTYYDDANYVTGNPHVNSGLTPENIAWAFTATHASNWHPVTWLSHMIDAQLYGMDPPGHHLSNVAIHTAASLLLLLLLCRTTGSLWPSTFVAAMFALHPLHVESVVWVAERKDVLSALFCFLTLMAYAEYAARQTRLWYLLSILTFTLGLMSKPMLVTLPAVMLLMDAWPLNRLGQADRKLELRRPPERLPCLAKEKIPFLFCALLSTAITIYAQNKGGAMRSLEEIPLGLRTENALISYVKYIGKTLWPQDLAFLYPMPSSIPHWQAVGALFFLLVISMATIFVRRKNPYLTIGWFWYLVTLLPVIGLIQVGSQSMADRYTYIPSIGLFIMLAWGSADLAKGVPYRKAILALLAGMTVTGAACLAWHQIRHWRDDVSLFQHAIEVTAENYVAHYDLAIALAKTGDMAASMREFQETLRLKPDYAEARNSLALALAQTGNVDAAIQEFRESIRLKPEYAEAHNNLGVAYANKGDLDAAAREFREALRLNPGFSDASANLEAVLAEKGTNSAYGLHY